MANPQQKEEGSKKAKRPTSVKRQLQSEKKRLRNKAARSRVKTAVKSFLAQVSKKDTKESVQSLSEINSLVDKGVKNGIYKKNKASRIKARMAARLATQAA